MRVINDVRGLEGVVGSRPLPSMLKTIDELDEHCVAILAAAPIAILGHRTDDGAGLGCTIVGGRDGFAVARTPDRLEISLPEGVAPAVGSPVGTAFLVPGLGETLRVNGRVGTAVDGNGADSLVLEVDEAFLHCAKCILRSDLWEGGRSVAEPDPVVVPSDGPLADAAVAEVLARSPFVALATCDADGGADVSPKGDPPGFVRILDGHRIAVPDRPGNRRTDSFHNLVEQPTVSVLALVPGETRVAELAGTASLTDDADLLAPMAVGGKRPPKIALVVDVERATTRDSGALAAAGLWDPDLPRSADSLPDMSKVFTDHVKRNKTKGLAATAVRKSASERMVRAGLVRDYRTNLY